MKKTIIGKITAIALTASMLTAGAAVPAAADHYAVPTSVTVSAAGSARAATNPGKVVIKTGYTNTETAIRISWNKAANASGYRIYRYNASTKKWVDIKTVSGGSTLTYRDANLTPGTTYKYKVKAYRKSGGKTYWGTASSTLTAKTKSAEPATITIKSHTSTETSVTLNWNKVANASGYRIYRYNASTEKWVNIKTVSGGATLTYRDTNLTTGTTYKYKVKAYRKLGGNTYWGTASSALTVKIQHVHAWTPVYKTVDVYEIRDKYEERPVYETKDKYEERPVYSEVPVYTEEKHDMCDCGRDITAEYKEYQASGGTLSLSKWRISIFWSGDHINHMGCSCSQWVTVQTDTEKVQTGTEKVKVGTERVQVGTEKVKVGTEQVKVGTKQVIDHYECSCGAIK